MEMADAIVINKADGENLKPAQLARTEFERAFHLFPPKPNNWIPKVLVASALADTGIGPIWELIMEFWDHTQTNGHFNRNRDAQNKHWVIQTIEDRLIQDFYHSPGIKEGLQKTLRAVQNKETSPFAAAERLLELFKT
jgi:LAO/AO transport system kinase